ncbi:hypothetical protein DCC85_09620 [Paenibacillus sp. CAA11]|uniref:hypothetical protein n=1 Tax=Paenibacillus sp. CAA11 TaxID=1532905 RepID=UPI000D393337|nr:hypothetical protein [Paenibacillus sp. CAA11]AWB44457.1 hypothetical protein DCC85_09620 [Paenibacillus sp. CAA11]
MFEQWNTRMLDLKEQIQLYHKAEQRLKALQKDLEEQELLRRQWEHKLQDEEEDVQRLEGTSLTGLFLKLVGRKAERLEREQVEVLQARMKYEEADRAVQDLKGQISALVNKLANLESAKRELDEIMASKERELLEQSPQLQELAALRSDLKLQHKEMDEAYRAGHRVISDLESAAEALHSAKNWGTYDMLGGGMISTHIKHGKMDDASNYLQNAQVSMRRFEKELNDVKLSLGSELELGDFMRFADYFFDSFIVDWAVQGRIGRSLDEVEEKLSEIRVIVRDLESAKRKLESEVRRAEQQYQQMIEQA